jgi:hypothetical protein
LTKLVFGEIRRSNALSGGVYMTEILGRGLEMPRSKEAQPLGVLGFLPAGLAEVSQGKKQSVVRSAKREEHGGWRARVEE